MNWALRRRIRTLIVSSAIVAAIIILLAWLTLRSNQRRSIVIIGQEYATPAVAEAKFTAIDGRNWAIPAPALTPAGKLLIPVAGIKPEQLRDTFTETRSEGRVHDAIDIPAPKGTPVIAAADGTIVKLYLSELGGSTIYQVSADGKFVYYYAHLDRYADGLAEGQFAKQGETIAHVGDTGNAGAGNYHLHFSVAQISSPKDFWHGVNINPYPLLTK